MLPTQCINYTLAAAAAPEFRKPYPKGLRATTALDLWARRVPTPTDTICSGRLLFFKDFFFHLRAPREAEIEIYFDAVVLCTKDGGRDRVTLGRLMLPDANSKLLFVCGRIVLYELLPPSETFNSELYCQELLRFKQEVEKENLELINRKGVVFHHDNARPHTCSATQQILEEFAWEVLMHSPYSSDIAPSDFYRFRSLQSSIAMDLCHYLQNGNRLLNIGHACSTHSPFLFTLYDVWLEQYE
ncbi:Histone-lysine N-methyltransferase SETMAR [Eumeta japonica]|uniref:Histone-lysine N-methyltransferase SETMAR n=1 Tax=Eumeta variegata TaxID=151549 RepID=A0A4C1WGC2_EUMVA|nr:Histone-lysine N-methyltransferase SETMAR [Eumeta japonica]